MGVYALSNTVYIKKCNAEHNWKYQNIFLKPDTIRFAHHTMQSTLHFKFKISHNFEANTVYHEDGNRIGTLLFPFPSSTMALESSRVPLPQHSTASNCSKNIPNLLHIESWKQALENVSYRKKVRINKPVHRVQSLLAYVRSKDWSGEQT